MLVVSATGNHWWLDGIVAIILLLIAFAIDDGVRRLATSRRERSIPLSADRLAVSTERTLDVPAERVEDEVFN